MTASVGLIGFGEVGQTLAGDLVRAGVRDLTAFDLKFVDTSSAPSEAAVRLGVKPAACAADAARADLVICAVTAAQDIIAAGAVANGVKGAVYLDVNSVSPGAKQGARDLIDSAGGLYVEAAIMSPIDPKGAGSPMLLGGPHAQTFVDRFARLGFDGAVVFSQEVGKAAAAKMCRSVIVKGMEALLSESLLTARRFGVEETVLNSLSDLLPLRDWPGLSRYMISRAVQHGVRRAEEMRESAQTVREAGLTPIVTAAIAERQDAMAQYRSALDQQTLLPMLDAILQMADQA